MADQETAARAGLGGVVLPVDDVVKDGGLPQTKGPGEFGGAASSGDSVARRATPFEEGLNRMIGGTPETVVAAEPAREESPKEPWEYLPGHGAVGIG